MTINALATLATLATEASPRTVREAIAPQPALVLRSTSPPKPGHPINQSINQSNPMKQQVVRATAVDSYNEPARAAILPVAQPALVPVEPHVGKVRTATMMHQSHQPMHHPGHLVHQAPRQIITTKYQKTQNSFDRHSPNDKVQVQVHTPVTSRRSFTSSPIHPSTQAHVITHQPMSQPMSHTMQPVYYSPMPVSYGPQPTMMMTPNGPMMMVATSGPHVQPMNQMMQPTTMIQVPVQSAPAPFGYQYVSHGPGQPGQMIQQAPLQQVQYVQAAPAMPSHMAPQGMSPMMPVHYQTHPHQSYLVQ